MRKIALAAGGIIALGLLAGAPSASAGSLSGDVAALAGGITQQAAAEDVRWVRRCWRQRVWWAGRWRWTTRCRSAWVGPRRYW